jgi:uncharacterized short protein YbdD (DUF466 family)
MKTCEVCHTEIEDGATCGMCEFTLVEQYREEHPGAAFYTRKEILREIQHENLLHKEELNKR